LDAVVSPSQQTHKLIRVTPVFAGHVVAVVKNREWVWLINGGRIGKLFKSDASCIGISDLLNRDAICIVFEKFFYGFYWVCFGD
jgi:hypothetical protein